MILALSRFKVANGLGDSVARAFLDRPRLVESADGFLGLEVHEVTHRGIAYYGTSDQDAIVQGLRVFPELTRAKLSDHASLTTDLPVGNFLSAEGISQSGGYRSEGSPPSDKYEAIARHTLANSISAASAEFRI
jgi:hypothetical protein